jgi:YVTN family beta-propeller protein
MGAQHFSVSPFTHTIRNPVIRRLRAVATVSLLAACGGESGPNGTDVASILVTPNPVALMQQASVQLQVAAFNEDGALLAGVPVTFTSDELELVTVSNAGVVKSVGPAGSTSVTVRAAGKSVDIPVTVGATGSSITVLPAQASLPQLGTLQLDPALLDLVGTEIAGATFSFATTNPQAAIVNGTGLVTSIGPAGEVLITVTGGGLTTQKTVTVEATPTSILLNPNPILLGRTSQLALGAQVLDAIGSPIAGAAITYLAEPASLLAVTTSGVLSSLGTPGTGSVTVTSGALATTVPVTISDAATLAGTIVRTVEATGAPYGVAIGPGGAYYGVALAGQFHVGDFGAQNLTVHEVSGTVMTGVAVHPTNGLVYATGSATDGLMEINPSTGSVLRRWTAPDQMYDVAISPDGSQLYVAGSPDRVYVVSTATMSSLKDFQAGGSVVHLLAHPSQPLVYASGQGIVREINVQSAAHRTFTHPAAQATALAIAGNRLYIGGEVGHLAVVDLASGVTTTVEVPCPIYDLVAAPDGQRLLSTCSGVGTALLLDAATLQVVKTIPTGGGPRRAAIKLDGSGAVIANEGGWYTHVE